MDPLTHTLVGASLAATSLGDGVRRARPALIIGANLPDVDVLSYFAGSDFALGFRRGWTHGLPAVALLPLALFALLRLWDRRQRRGEIDPPAAPGRLLGLCYLAVATHPTLDWLNTYGMRWWMPLRDTWTYGDSVFIIDPWLWLLLGCGWLLGRRPTAPLVVISALLGGLLLWAVASRLPVYLPVVGGVMVILALALIFRPTTGRPAVERLAVAGLLLAALHIGSLLVLHRLTVGRVEQELERTGVRSVDQLMVGPMPANPLSWDVVVRDGAEIRFGRFAWRGGGSLTLAERSLGAARGTDLWREVETRGLAKGFRRWVRFPWIELEGEGADRQIYLLDARYTRQRTRGFGGTRVTLPAD